MKAKSILAALLLMVAGLQSACAQQAMQVWFGGKFDLYYISAVDSVRFVNLVTDIYLSEEALQMTEGDTKVLSATVYPIDASESSVSWESSSPSVATVEQTGKVTAVAAGSCVITCSATDGSGVKAECQVTVKSGSAPDPGNHEWVDLGLPSGTKWATCNVGANSSEEYGDYFAWGETEPKSTYNWSTYKWCNGSYNTMTKYCTDSYYGYNGFTDGKTELDSEDDAAAVNWGGSWRMPTFTQIEELFNNCSRQWTTLNGVNGTLVTGPNGNTIFLPAAGRRWDGDLSDAGSYGTYWSSSLHPYYDDTACYLYFNSGNWYWYSGRRYYGRSVRPVCP